MLYLSDVIVSNLCMILLSQKIILRDLSHVEFLYLCSLYISQLLKTNKNAMKYDAFQNMLRKATISLRIGMWVCIAVIHVLHVFIFFSFWREKRVGSVCWYFTFQCCSISVSAYLYEFAWTRDFLRWRGTLSFFLFLIFKIITLHYYSLLLKPIFFHCLLLNSLNSLSSYSMWFFISTLFVVLLRG